MGTPQGGLRVPPGLSLQQRRLPQCEVPLGTDAPKKGLPPPSGETEIPQEGLPCPRSSLQTGKRHRQISAVIPNLPAWLQSPASLQQSLWKVGEEEKAKHFKGSIKLL